MIADQVLLLGMIAFFLLPGATGFVLTAAASRLNRGRRRQLAALTAELPAVGLDAVNTLIRASRISLWARRIGWLFAIGVTLGTLELGDGVGGIHGDTCLIFGCAYLAAVALGESLMPKPARGRAHSAALDPRRVADYLPRWLTWSLHAAVGLGIALSAAAGVITVTAHPTTLVCSPAPGIELQQYISIQTTPLSLVAGVTVGYTAIWAATRGVLTRIAGRARPSEDPTLIRMDDMLRRAAALRVVAAGLGAALLTLTLPTTWLANAAHHPCAPASSTAEALLRWLMLASAAAGLATLMFVPAGASQFRPARLASPEASPGAASTSDPDPAPDSASEPSSIPEPSSTPESPDA